MKLNRLQEPEIHEISKINIGSIEKLNLDNGLPLWLMNTGSQELVKIQIAVPAGTLYQSQALISFFTNQLLKEGSKNFTASEIAEKMDFYGAFFDSKTSRDLAYINVFSLNKHLDAVLEIIADVLVNPSMHQHELNTILDQEKQAYQIRIQKVKNIAQRKFNQFLFGNQHPYGSSAVLADYEQLKLESLQSFFKNNYQVNDWQIYVSGKVNHETLKVLNRHFGQLHRGVQQVQIPDLPLKNTFEAKAHFIEHKGAMQTALKMGKMSINRNHVDYPVLSLSQTILGGFFGSRLMQNIREDKGYTYGIHSNIIHHQQASYFSISSELGGEFAEKALEEVHKELKRLRSEKIDQNELNLVKNYMAGSLLKSLNGPFALAEMMRMLNEYNLSPNYFSDYIQSFQAASSEDVLQVAEKYLNESEMMSIMVGSK